MRRMNSMLLGHQGASGRTDCMYFSMASRVAGSSQDSGRCTMRAGHLHVVDGRQRLPPASTHGVDQLGRSGSTRGVEMDLQRADARRQVEDARQRPRAPAAHSIRAWTRKRRSRSSTGGPILDQQVARRRPGGTTTVGISRPLAQDRRSIGRRRGAARWQRGAGRRRQVGDGGVLRAARRRWPAPASTRRKRTRVAGLQLARSSTARPATMVAGQTKPPRLGPSGPEDDRHVAGEVDRADGVGVVVDVGRMQPGLAAVACAPTAAWGRSGARRCGWSCNAPPSRWRRRSSMSSSVKKSGAPCGP